MTIAKLMDRQRATAHARCMEEHAQKVLERRKLEELWRIEADGLCETARKVSQVQLAGMRPSPELWLELAVRVRKHETAKMEVQAFDLKQQMRSRRGR